jgi:hypothetical protein
MLLPVPAAVSGALLMSLGVLLSGCAVVGGERVPESFSASAADPASPEERSWSRSLGDVAGQLQPLPAWEHYRLPGKQETRYDFVRADGRVALHASSSASASMFRTAMAVPVASLGNFQFSWKVASLIDGADVGARETDDAPARVVLAFDGDRSRFSMREAAMAELARAITGEEMPYATLMYVWCNQRPVGTVITHPRSSRVRAIVVESGSGRVGQWTTYQRDVLADFNRAFGEAPGRVTGVALMTDSDNTHSQAQAWYGPLRFGVSALAQASAP